MIYDPDQTVWNWVNNDDATGNGSVKWDSYKIGPTFFEAANRLPEGTPVTWGLNLAYNDDDYLEQITTMAQQVFDRCTNLDIVSFEIGNEPDLYYASSKFRDADWGGDVYTEEWLSRASAIYEQVVKPKGLPQTFFEPGATSHTSGTTFGISQLVSDGITKETNGSSYVKVWSQHDYSYFTSVATYPLTIENILNFDTNEDQFENQAADQLTQADATPYGYALREMGWVGPAGAPNVSDVFGGALYTLNFLLYAASENLTGVQFHLTGFGAASAWQPVQDNGMAPYPRPLYYGHAAFNQIIGPTCTAQVSQISLSSPPSGYDGYIRAYSIYQSGSLSSVAIINAKMANVSESDKANLTVSLSMPTSLAGKTVYLSYLTNDGVDAKYNTTWNGISFEQSGDGTPTQVSDAEDTATIGSDGTLTISVRDSAAVVGQIGSKVGSLEADSTACKTMASQSPGTYSLSKASSSASSKPANGGTTSQNGNNGSQSGSADSSNKAGTTRITSSGVLVTLLVPCLSLMTGFVMF